jgi:hypothetical protein
MGLGIRVIIPARRDWWIVPLVIFLSAGTGLEWFYPSDTLPNGNLSQVAWIGIVVLAAMTCIFVCWLLWGMTGKTILEMDPFELKLVRRIIGVEWDTRRFATYDMKNLRYIPPVYIHAFQTDTNPATSKIQFQTKDKTIRFARGITEKEAGALYDRMIEVYKFPQADEPDQSAVAR